MTGDRLELRPGSLPVEQLPDVSWQRIERKLFAQLASGAPRAIAPVRAGGVRRRTWLIAGGVALAAAAAALLLVTLRGGGEGARRAEQPDARSPSRIATAEAPSAVSVGDVSLEIAPHSAILVDDDRERGVLFVLERGEATFRVAPVGDRPPVVVQAGDVRIEVVGTAFAVSREGDSARVVVYEGVVVLVQKGERSQLGPGSVWPAAPVQGAVDEEPVAPPADPEPAPVEPAGAPRVKKPPADRGRAATPLDAPRLTDKDSYNNAHKIERSDPDRARALYAELVRRGGVYAPLALYSHALLEDSLGNKSAARKLLRQYLARYPDGLNAVDARELLEDSGTK